MAIKKLLVLGATGGTGRQVVAQALQHGHEVTVFVRSPERLTSPRDRVRVVTGSLPEDADAFAAAARGQDVVISALGRGGSLKALELFASVGEHLSLHGVPKISRADAADCLLTQVDDRRYLKKGVLVSY